MCILSRRLQYYLHLSELFTPLSSRSMHWLYHRVTLWYEHLHEQYYLQLSYFLHWTVGPHSIICYRCTLWNEHSIPMHWLYHRVTLWYEHLHEQYYLQLSYLLHWTVGPHSIICYRCTLWNEHSIPMHWWYQRVTLRFKHSCDQYDLHLSKLFTPLKSRSIKQYVCQKYIFIWTIEHLWHVLITP